MLQRPTFQSTWLPLSLAALALVIINLGLYTRLASQPIVTTTLSLPYNEDFASTPAQSYAVFGGDWEIRDEALVQLSTSGFDLMNFIPVELDAAQAYRFGVTVRYLGGTMGGGLIFNSQQPRSNLQSHMARFNVAGDQLWVIYGYFDEVGGFVGQGSTPLGLAPDDVAPHRLEVVVNDETYTLLFDSTPVVADIPLQFKGGAVGLVAATSQVAFDDLSIDLDTGAALVADPPTADNIAEATEAVINPPTLVENPANLGNGQLIFRETFDGEGSGPGTSSWQPISGDWDYADGRMIQLSPAGFDLSTIHQTPVSYPLVVEATFTHDQGAGAGILFNLPQPTLKNGGHMARYVDEAGTIAWGYFDDTGVFNGQGSAQATPPANARHTMRVVSDGSTYSVLVDETVIAANIPVINPTEQGYIGVTASQSVVNFDEVSVFSGEMPAVGDDSAARIDSAAATGNWMVENTQITQLSTENTDYVAGTGLAGETFNISVELVLPEGNTNAGAGIIFHMDGRDDFREGHMVRFGGGGQELFWGRYDADGVFAGQGGVPFDLSQGEPHTLLLMVHEGDFDIVVNGEMLVESIPLERASGWIGLVSFGGPVTFDNVSLQLGQ